MTDAQAIEREADGAAARGDVARARALLATIVARGQADFGPSMKLAAMCRATGDATGALAAVERALVASPLDFTALLLRATLLDQLGRGEADQAYAHALAQRPATAPSGAMAAAIARAEERADKLAATRRARLEAAAAQGGPSTAHEAKRLARFRTNITRETRAFHAEPSHYHYPALLEAEFHDRAAFPWLPELEAATDAIAAEFEAVAGAERSELVPYIQYAEHEPLRQWRALNHSRDWTAIHLLRNGSRVEANARHCPRTMASLARLPQPDVPGCSPNAMFSLLVPGATIPPHTGVANTRLVCHLPLVVPAGCWFRVGAETRFWERGAAFVFDDTIEHEAANPSDALRVVFIFDVWHPGLSAAERDAVAAVMGADVAGTGQPL